MNITRIRNARILIAIGAVSLALVAAGPANAEPKQPVNKDGKKSCKVVNPGTGTTTWVPHDTVVVKDYADGTSAKQKCDDGQWQPATYRHPTGTLVGTSGTLVGTSGTYAGASSSTTGTFSGTSGTTATYAR